MDNETRAQEIIGTWTHNWPHVDYPDLLVRPWDGSSMPGWVEVVNPQTGKIITRDYAILAANMLERNWYSHAS